MSTNPWIDRTEDDERRVAETIDAAAARASFRLNYGATPEKRDLHSFGIAGPALPNAYYVMGGPINERGGPRSETGAGDWADPDHSFMGPDTTEDEHIDRWALAAISEAVHEALEWFWVDGEPWLDPHGKHEKDVLRLSEELAHALAKLRRGAA